VPLPSAIVGLTTEPYRYTVDARWLMAYVAGIDDSGTCYTDTTHELAMHPLFPVCVEWDAIVALRHGPGAVLMSAAEQARAVHAEHDLHIFRPFRAGSTVTVTATAIGVEQRSPGAYLLKRIDTRDASGALLCSTYQGTLYRGVTVDGPPRPAADAPVRPSAVGGSAWREFFDIPWHAAHTYTECARIWNPIHTDRAHALAAGLPDIILHGTATLARAVSLLVQRAAGGTAARIRRIGCRFSGMVRMPSRLCLHVDAQNGNSAAFRVLDEAGSEVVRHGFITFV
jgi:acyl dehydratase